MTHMGISHSLYLGLVLHSFHFAHMRVLCNIFLFLCGRETIAGLITHKKHARYEVTSSKGALWPNPWRFTYRTRACVKTRGDYVIYVKNVVTT